MKLFGNWRISTQVTFLILLGTGILVGLLSVYDYVHARAVIEQELRERAINLARATANEMEIVSRAVEKVVMEVAIILRQNPFSEDGLQDLLEESLREHQEIDGLGILLEESGKPVRMPFVYRSQEEILYQDIVREVDYPYYLDDWYQLAVHIGPSWSEPYFGSVSQRLRVSYAIPLMDANGQRIGVVEADVDLNWLTQEIDVLRVGKHGKAFVASGNGTFIAYPEESFIMRESLFSIARESGRPELRKLGQAMQRGESGFVPLQGFRDERDYWLAYTNIAQSGWSMGVLFDQAELYAELMALVRGKVFYGGLCGLALIALAIGIARRISTPINELERATSQLATGDLEVDLPVGGGSREVSRLVQSFRRMRDDLRHHIVVLKRTTEEKARIDQDLEVAREIQRGLLPIDFKSVGRRCRMHAELIPAREVGGDFYDFEMLDENRLYVAVGDASGKGVPAALFVSLTRTLLQIFIREHPPEEALRRVNEELARDNEANMFVTLFVGVLDLSTGELAYANGGHNPPFRLIPEQQQVELVPMVNGVVVGPMPGMPFDAGRIQLKDAERIVFYTDGVVEAEDGASFYGDDRFCEFIVASGGQSPEATCRQLLEDLASYRGDYEQTDDITILVMDWHPLSQSPKGIE